MSEVLTVFFQRCCRCSGEKVGAKEQESRETDRERERERDGDEGRGGRRRGWVCDVCVCDVCVCARVR